MRNNSVVLATVDTKLMNFIVEIVKSNADKMREEKVKKKKCMNEAKRVDSKILWLNYEFIDK